MAPSLYVSAPKVLAPRSWADIGVDADVALGAHLRKTPGPGLCRHLQRVRRQLERVRHPCARESWLPHAQLVAKQVSVQWVMEARRVSVAEGVRQEDVTQPTDGVEVGSEAPSEPSIAP